MDPGVFLLMAKNIIEDVEPLGVDGEDFEFIFTTDYIIVSKVLLYEPLSPQPFSLILQIIKLPDFYFDDDL